MVYPLIGEYIGTCSPDFERRVLKGDASTLKGRFQDHVYVLIMWHGI